MTLKPIEKIILYTVITCNALFSVLLLSGNMPLNGLTLTGALKSTAKHTHGHYDNSFITGVNYKFNPATMEFDALVEGSSLEAANVRCPSGMVSGGSLLNNGPLYQHGSILFVEDNNFNKKKVYLTDKQITENAFYAVDLINSGFIKDENGWYKETINPLAVGFVNCSGLVQITPDYKKNGVEIAGTFIDRDGAHKVAQEEVNRIKELCRQEIKQEILNEIVVKKGKK